MSDSHQRSTSIWHKVWIAFRFIVFGVCGFIVMFWSSLYFVAGLFGNKEMLSPFVCFPLAVVGAAMTLFGVGQWGRRAYLLVFLTFPASAFLLALLPSSLSGDKGSAVIFILLAVLISLTLVRWYYRRRDAKVETARPVAAPAPTTPEKDK